MTKLTVVFAKDPKNYLTNVQREILIKLTRLWKSNVNGWQQLSLVTSDIKYDTG